MKGIMYLPEYIPLIVKGIKTQTRRLDGLKGINENPDEWVLKQFTSERGRVSINNGPLKDGSFCCWTKPIFDLPADTYRFIKPRYLPNEEVYIKETWAIYYSSSNDWVVNYKDSEKRIVKPSQQWLKDNQFGCVARSRSPMFMPEWASRYHQLNKSVTPERLWDITPEDCTKEGINKETFYSFVDKNGTTQCFDIIQDAYLNLFYNINPQYKGINVWNWRIEFEFEEVK